MQTTTQYEQQPLSLLFEAFTDAALDSGYFGSYQLCPAFSSNRIILVDYNQDMDYEKHPELHHYHCLDEDCEYCQAIEYGLRCNYDLEDFVSYADFIRVWPKQYDENGDWWRDTPGLFSYYCILTRSSWFEVEVEKLEETPDVGYIPERIHAPNCSGKLLNDFDWKNAYVVGAGAYGIVITDRQYAIKVGFIEEYKVQQLRESAAQGFSPPVYCYECGIRLDPRIIRVLEAEDIYSNGMDINWRDYVREDGYIDLLISAYAEPVVDHEYGFSYKEYDDDGNLNFDWACVRKLYSKLMDACISWEDAHPGNIAKYNGGLVVIDF